MTTNEILTTHNIVKKKQIPTILYQNVRGLRTKLLKLRNRSIDTNHEIICITETWLHKGIQNCEFTEDNFSTFRCDREDTTNPKERGGGVMIMIKNTLRVKRSFTITDQTENIWVEITRKKDTNIIIGCIYFPPGSDTTLYQNVFDAITANLINTKCNLVLCGDLNIPNDYVTSLPAKPIPKAALLQDFLQIMEAKQINHMKNSIGRTLDMVIVNENCNATVTREIDYLVKEDLYHPTLSIALLKSQEDTTWKPSKSQNSKFNPEINLLTSRKNEHPNQEVQYNFKKANYKEIFRDLAKQNWQVIKAETNVNSMTEKLYEIVYSILSNNIETTSRRKTPHHPPKFPSWISKETIDAIKIKNHLRQKATKSKEGNHQAEFSAARKVVKKMMQVDRAKEEQRKENALNDDPKEIFRSLNRNKRNNAQGTFLINETLTDDPYTIGVGFRNIFYPKPEKINPVRNSCNPSINHDTFKWEISTSLITKTISELKHTNAVGRDNIPMFIVKGCAEALATPLKYIFEKAMETGTYPDKWKEAKIIPVHKGKGKFNDIQEYRPIAIVSNISKVFEAILRKQLESETAHLISERQHGFIKKRSTITNLTLLSRNVFEALRNNEQLDIFFSDFSKAFDNIDHQLLEKKLNNMKVSTNLVNLIMSFNLNRTNFIYVNGTETATHVSNIGVPQGSPLGGQLFIAYINDLSDEIDQAEHEIFADDAKVYRCIKSREDTEKLQIEINKLAEWAKKNKLALNLSKCQVMSVTRRNEIIVNDYKINTTQIERVTGNTDLGVWIDDTFTFEEQRERTIRKATQHVGFILRETENFQRWESVVKIAHTIVWPILDYAAILWSPHTARDIKRIERVQTRLLRVLFIRFFGKSNLNFAEYYRSSSKLREIFNAEPFVARRERQCATFFKNIINDKIDCTRIKDQLNWNECQIDLRTKETFRIPNDVTANYLRNDPLLRFYNICNKFNLTNAELNMSSETFKNWITEKQKPLTLATVT